MRRRRRQLGAVTVWLATWFAATAADAVSFTSTPRTRILDNSAITDTIDTSSDFTTETVISVYLEISITHTYAGDLTFELTSPSGTQLQILARPGDTHPDETFGEPYGSSADLDRREVLTFTDSATTSAELLGDGVTDVTASSYYPDADGWSQDISSFAGFAGEIARGDWTLRVGDYASSDTGRLVAWTLYIEAPEPGTDLLMVVGLLGLTIAGNRDRRSRARVR